MQQCFRRDASDIETGAAKGRHLLDHRGLEPELGGTDGADIAARAGADHDEIVRSHDATPFYSSCPALGRASTPFFCKETRRGWPAQARHETKLQIQHDPRRVLEVFLNPH